MDLMVFRFYSDELVMCDDTRPQWPLRALSRCVETLAAWNCGQNCPLIRAQKPLYQYFPTGSMTRACHISRSHHISRSTDLYRDMLKQV
jgi:hypothetical protein